MPFFSLTQDFIGIEASPTKIKIASLRKGKKGLEISLLREYPFDENVKPLYSFPKEGISISVLAAKETLVRECDIQLKKEKDIAAALAFQIEPLLPYPIERAIVQWEIIEKISSSTRLTVLSVRKDHLQAHLDVLRSQKIEPEVVVTAPLALAALSTLFQQHERVSLVIHKSGRETICSLVEKGKLLTARAFDPDLNFQAELQKTTLAFASSHKAKPIETIIYLGNEQTDIQIIESSTGKQPLTTSTLPLSRPKEEIAEFALAIGAALTQLHKKKSYLNFRQQEYRYPRPFRRLKKPLFLFYLSTALLLSSLFGVVQTKLARQKHKIESQYLSLLTREEKNDLTFPKTISEYEERLSQIEQKITSQPDTFPLLPGVPKVGEILTWLSKHPDLYDKDGSLITIDSFNYTMVNAPDFSRKKDHYSVKVEIEFSSVNPIAARKFHDALLSESLYIDKKKEIEWGQGKGKYKTSFYLKDNTRYH